VAAHPAAVRELRALGVNVLVERGAGEGLGIPDGAYWSAGAGLVPRERILTGTDIVVALRPLGPEAGSAFRRGQVLVTLVTRLGSPLSAPFIARTWCDAGLTVFGPDLVPEAETGTAARPLDVTSSLEELAGYKAALLAADLLDRPLPAGSTPALPARAAHAVIVGHGHGARRAERVLRALGAEVRPTEGPPSGLEHSDIVIASVRPGLPHRLPVLVTARSLEAMRPGAVIVDMTAGEEGGSVEGVRPETVRRMGQGVTVVGGGRLAERLPRTASETCARHVLALIRHIAPAGRLDFDPADPTLSAVLVTHGGLMFQEHLWRAIVEQTAAAGVP
jgi:NAD(P) transhydrogenase subunit alpha